MNELRDVDAAVYLKFIELLRRGLTIGPLLAEWASSQHGSLKAMVPVSCGPINHEMLEQDVFYPEHVHVTDDIVNLIKKVAQQSNDAAIYFETNWSSIKNRGTAISSRLSWMRVLDQSREAGEACLVAGMPARELSVQTWLEIKRDVKRYVSIIVVGSLPSRVMREPGAIHEIESSEIHSIIDRALIVLVGVFDEQSVLIWCNSKVTNPMLERNN